MGGGGSYYDRDVTDDARRTSGGFSDLAEKSMDSYRVDYGLLPFKRRLKTMSKNPLVYAFDVTGSMGNLPKIIFDKMPMIAGQIADQKYLEDADVSLAAVGDIESDSAPLQVCDFSAIRQLDSYLKRIWVESNGGSQHFESYEFMAYYYAYLCDIPKAQMPIFLFTGDEAFRPNLRKGDLERHFGGNCQSVDADIVFRDLRKKFKDNVFLIHKKYASGKDGEIVSLWERALGKERVIKLPQDLAVADVTLGVLAIAGGTRTLDEYISDIKNRPLDMGVVKYKPQSQQRIDEVRDALESFAGSRNALTGSRRSRRAEPRKAAKASKTKKPNRKGDLLL